MWLFAPCDKEDKIMNSGGKAFWHCQMKTLSPENEGFWHHISVSLTIFTGEKKENGK